MNNWNNLEEVRNQRNSKENLKEIVLPHVPQGKLEGILFVEMRRKEKIFFCKKV